MDNIWLQRTNLLVGDENLKLLQQMHVLVVGLGGVGSYAAEFAARAGVGAMTIIDGDVVDITNINRQLPALQSTVGLAKAEVMKHRLLDINPQLKLTVITEFLTPQKMNEIVTEQYNYVFDCIDSMQPKQYLIVTCLQKEVRIISSMGAGGRINPAKVQISDIAKTFNCPFAQQIRKGLKRKGVYKGVTSVFSSELVDKSTCMETDGSNYKKSFYGTISYIPALFGLNMASIIVQETIARKRLF